MLPLHYTFLILALSSSVIAVGSSKDYQQDGTDQSSIDTTLPKSAFQYHRQSDKIPELLIGNHDTRLPKAFWARARVRPKTPAAAKDEDAKWTNDVQYLDDVLQFVREADPRAGVQKVELRRIIRELLPNEPGPGPSSKIITDKYRVVRSQRGDNIRPAKTRHVFPEPLLIEHCAMYLNNTYWGRIMEILGERQGRRLTKLDPIQDARYIMYIQWMINPTLGVEVPYVTLTPAEMLEGKDVLMAKESFQLETWEAEIVEKGHEWQSGFIAMLAPLNGYYHKANENNFLLQSEDVRLQNGLWGRIDARVPDDFWGQARTLAARTVPTWDLDDVIQFESETETSLGVGKVNLRRIKRKLMSIPKRQALRNPTKIMRYSVVRTHGGPAETFVLKPSVAIEDFDMYLHNTYWGRIPHIVGLDNSGPEKDWEHFIYIHWMFSAKQQKDVPFVTFLRIQDFPNLLKAEEYYDLDEAEVKTLREAAKSSGSTKKR